jgi:hypothetical protein
LSDGEIDDPVSRSDRVKKVTGMQDEIWLECDYLIDCGFEGMADILFPLIESGSRKFAGKPACPEMSIRNMNESH